MKKMINAEKIEGYLYDTPKLELKTVQNKDSKNYGKEYISGSVDVAVDEEGLNVLTVHYTYLTEKTASGATNSTFKALKSILDTDKTWIGAGKENAIKLRLTPSLALNDFYNNNDELVSSKRNEGGFVNIVTGELSPEAERNSFDCDIVITNVRTVDNNNDNDDSYVVVKGAIFNFRGEILPVEFVVRREDGIGYFESLEASSSHPVFTRVKGKITSMTVKHTIEEDSAFGAASVKTVSRTTKEWEITWAKPVEYEFGESDTITVEELQKAIQDREVKLADIKKRRDEYIATRNNTSGTTENKVNVPTGGFNF